MRQKNERWRLWRPALCSLAAGSALCVTGCQVDIGGQTLPTAYYQSDDIQYFPPGPEFMLSREAAAQKAFDESRADQQR